MTSRPPDGGLHRKKKSISPFFIDEYTVSNKQFDCFVKETGYVTETEAYGWSFVFEGSVSPETIAEVDDPTNGELYFW